MTKDHYVFEDPKDVNVKVWRYMDFTKFIWLLENEALYFPRSDKLGDPFEGSITKLNIQLRPISAKKQNPDDPEVMMKLFSDLSQFRIFIRQWTYINCWHMNEYESAAMWNTYTKSNEAIAIQTTYINLKNLLPDNVYMGIVKYIDYDSDYIPIDNTFYPFINKRKSFEHENEVRAIIQDVPTSEEGIDTTKSNNKNGVSINIDPEKLIDRVYIAPTSPTWFRDLVKSLINKYKIECNIIQSSMDNDPVF